MNSEISNRTSGDSLLAEKDAAKWLNISLSWLQHSRLKGDGPNFVRIGRAIRYKASSLKEYIENNTLQSTSEMEVTK